MKRRIKKIKRRKKGLTRECQRGKKVGVKSRSRRKKRFSEGGYTSLLFTIQRTGLLKGSVCVALMGVQVCVRVNGRKERGKQGFQFQSPTLHTGGQVFAQPSPTRERSAVGMWTDIMRLQYWTRCVDKKKEGQKVDGNNDRKRNGERMQNGAGRPSCGYDSVHISSVTTDKHATLCNMCD